MSLDENNNRINSKKKGNELRKYTHGNTERKITFKIPPCSECGTTANNLNRCHCSAKRKVERT